MGKRKQTALIQMINSYASLNTEDKLHFDSFVRSQQVKLRPAVNAQSNRTRRRTAGTKVAAIPTDRINKLRDLTGGNTADCLTALQESDNDLDTAETLIRKRGQAAKG